MRTIRHVLCWLVAILLLAAARPPTASAAASPTLHDLAIVVADPKYSPAQNAALASFAQRAVELFPSYWGAATDHRLELEVRGVEPVVAATPRRENYATLEDVLRVFYRSHQDDYDYVIVWRYDTTDHYSYFTGGAASTGLGYAASPVARTSRRISGWRAFAAPR